MDKNNLKGEMMHFKVYLFTDSFPTDELVEERMSKFYDYSDCENPDERPFFCDYFGIGGRYCASLKLKADDSNDPKYHWYAVVFDRTNLFRCNLIESRRNRYDDWELLRYLGFRDGYIRVDGALVGELVDFDPTDCYAYVLNDGTANSRQRFALVNGKWGYVENEDFDYQAKSAFKCTDKMYVTVIDCHE